MLQTMVLRPGTATHEHREPKVREVLYMLVVLVVYLGVLIELYKDMLVLRGVLNLYEQLFSSFSCMFD